MKTMLSLAKFIEFPNIDNFSAPIFKKQFSLKELPQSASLSVCALGLGYVYLNGSPITSDLFTAPVSDYSKTLWYNVYEVKRFLKVGENELCVIVGNGFYGWDYAYADFKGTPKLLLALSLDQETIFTDESWLAGINDSPVIYNELRSGETYDCSRGENFRLFGTKDYLPVKLSENSPKGTLRECLCQPIREFERFAPVKTFINRDGNTVFDFGQNVSGYLDITLSGKAGDLITIRHGEHIFEDGTLDHRGMNKHPFHRGHEFHTNKIILSGNADSPVFRFAYHGFRYAEIEGECEIIKINSVFVHQAVDKISTFYCSNELLNKISNCSDISVWSNMFYSLTDCPTREKLGWANDAVASAEQILMNFDSAPFFEKWLTDVFDSVTQDGNLPPIIPAWGWTTENYTGVLCTGIIFELPFAMYQSNGNKEYIRAAYPYMKRHLDWLLSNFTSDGLISIKLGDWGGGDDFASFTPVKFVDTALTIKYAKLITKVEEILGIINPLSQEIYHKIYNRFFSLFYDKKNEKCTVDTQTAVSMMICIKNDGISEGLIRQLTELVLKKDNHLDCGMVGLQYLIPALDMIGRNDLVYKIITATGYPSYSLWMEDGATTLYEAWNMKQSANHHMYSSVVSWFMKKLVGISQKIDTVGYKTLVISPYFPDELNFCEGNLRGTATAKWERNGKDIRYVLTHTKDVNIEIIVPDGYLVNSSINNGKYELIFTKK